MKKFVMFILVMAFAFTMVSGVALAANVPYGFSLQNTGQTFNYDSGSGNNKVYTNRGWTLYVDSISVTSGSAGMAFVPVRYYDSAWRVSGIPKWVTRVKSLTGAYGSGQAVANTTYRIAARIDDAYQGPFSASGTWNSDT